MSADAAFLGALATAGVLGVTHVIEPDHVAGISSLTSRYGDARLSAVVGACFSLGHVVLVVAWLVVGYVILGRTAFGELFDTVGTLGVGLVLGVLGATMIVSGLRGALFAHSHEHEHEHGHRNRERDTGRTHSHRHVHLFSNTDHGHGAAPDPDRDRDHRSDHDHDHGHGVRASLGARMVGTYLKMGVVGALFTLSPPLSMIAFAATLFPQYGSDTVVLAVLAYTVSITLTMSLVGAGVGALFGATSVDPRIHGLARGVAGLFVGGFAISMFVGSVPAFA